MYFCPVLFVSRAWSDWPAADTNMPNAADEHHRLMDCLPAGVDSLDPTNHRSRISQIVLKHLFDSLTARNSANEVIPQALSWLPMDGTQWQFKLRRGVRFHNGQELKGYGKALPAVLLPNAFGYHPRPQPYPFNRAIARQLPETAAYPEDRKVVICSHPDNLIFAQNIAIFLTQVGLQIRMRIASTMRPQTTGSDAPRDLFKER
jgi:MarR-like DNA-binding transcriptional regulator SgrR of sgrS sRNA